MGLLEQVSADIKSAMLAQDKVRTAALRNIRAAFIEALKADGSTDLSDAAALGVLRTLAKRRKESIDAYVAGGREDLVAEERADLAVIEGYLPQQADEATTRGWITAAIAASGASSVKDMGRVMGALTKAHGDALDKGLASRLVKELLGG